MKFTLFLFIIVISFFSCSESPTKGDEQIEYFSRFDYQFVQNKYFFVDEYYQDYWEQGFSDDLQQFQYENGKLITQLNVWVSVALTDTNAYHGVAVINPDDYKDDNLDEIEPDPNRRNYIGKFRKLYPDEYSFDAARGFFWLPESAQIRNVIAIAYATENEEIGAVSEGGSNYPILLRLIKTKFPLPSDSTWFLMMRNVYDFGDSLVAFTNFDISISKWKTEETYEGDRSFLNLLGLDILDEQFEPEPDDQLDMNAFFLNKSTGSLIFPGLQPFDPLPKSQFQIRNKSNIYNTINPISLTNSSRYKISMVGFK